MWRAFRRTDFSSARHRRRAVTTHRDGVRGEILRKASMLSS
jgi:hypothetical protein